MKGQETVLIVGTIACQRMGNVMKLNQTDIVQLNMQVKKRIGDYGDKLYHYTSMNTFLSMLNSRELWLSNTGTMNDKKETIYFIEMIQNELKLYQRKDFFDKVYEQISEHYRYAFCLSTEKDDAAQWERYADSAKGVCIVFNVEELCKCLYGYSGFMFNRVFYDETVAEGNYCKIVKSYFETGQIDVYKTEEELIRYLLDTGGLHKHRSFFHECEVRITATDNVRQYGVEYALKELGNVVKKVLILKPDVMGQNKGTYFEKLIDNVILGPRSQQNIKILQEYIVAKGFYTMANNIIQSECPLR